MYNLSIEKVTVKGLKMQNDRQEVDININIQVKIFLTEYGREIFKKHYEELNCLEYMPNPFEEIKISMWDMAKIFGEVLYMGNTNIPFVDNKVDRKSVV